MYITYFLKKNVTMSRLTELKKQYPELNMSIFDLISQIDKSDTYKYHPLLCKLFSKRWSDNFFDPAYDSEVKESMELLGVSTDEFSKKSLRMMFYLSEFFNRDDIKSIGEFINYMDRGLIEKKDISQYHTMDDINSSVSVAKLKEINKSLETQIIKEYEDDTWLFIRPLTFEASSKYGASTRWCTTYSSHPQHFEKYGSDGVLVYFINKKTGYKFAGFKGLHHNRELSFWSASDERIDSIQLEIDDNILSIVRKIMASNQTNYELTPIDMAPKSKREYKQYNIYNDDIELGIDHITTEEPGRVIQLRRNDTTMNEFDEMVFIPVRSHESKTMSIWERIVKTINTMVVKIL
jgi:hypothetical protein